MLANAVRTDYKSVVISNVYLLNKYRSYKIGSISFLGPYKLGMIRKRRRIVNESHNK